MQATASQERPRTPQQANQQVATSKSIQQKPYVSSSSSFILFCKQKISVFFF
jgi:hypothetical protein